MSNQCEECRAKLTAQIAFANKRAEKAEQDLELAWKSWPEQQQIIFSSKDDWRERAEELEDKLEISQRELILVTAKVATMRAVLESLPSQAAIYKALDPDTGKILLTRLEQAEYIINKIKIANDVATNDSYFRRIVHRLLVDSLFYGDTIGHVHKWVPTSDQSEYWLECGCGEALNSRDMMNEILAGV
jgi:hypothetical protein